MRFELIRTWITVRCFDKALAACAKTLTGLVAVGTNLSAQQIISKLYTSISLPTLRHLTLGQRKWPFVDISLIQSACTVTVENLTLVEVEDGWLKPPRVDHDQLYALTILRQWITDTYLLPELKTLGLGLSDPEIARKALGDVPNQRNIRIITRKIVSEYWQNFFTVRGTKKGYIPFVTDSIAVLHSS